MVEFCNIYPIANQSYYKHEGMVMILAHLVCKKAYKARYFNKGQYIIMDNGLFEKAQVSTSLQTCIDIAKESKIPVSEIIVPDAVNDGPKTIRLFEDNLDTIKSNPQYNYMFVAQCQDEDGLKSDIDYINQYAEILPNLTVGISKLTPMDRASDKAIEVYKTCKYPIHFLGLKSSFSEVARVKNLIRSCDSSQLSYMIKNETKTPRQVLTYARRTTGGADVDLATDSLDKGRLDRVRKTLDCELVENFIYKK